MRADRISIVAAAVLLSQAAQVVVAHGDDDSMHMDTGMNSSLSQNTAYLETEAMISYFANGTHTSSIIAHATFMVLAWVFILPVGIMFSITRSRLALPAQFLFLIVNAIGLLLGIVFNARTPDLYPNNAHHKMGWVVTWMMVAQVVMGLLFAYSGRDKAASGTADERAAFLPLTQDAMAQMTHNLQSERNPRWSGDSGQGTEPPSPSDEAHVPLSKPPEDDAASEGGELTGHRYLRGKGFDKYLTKHIPSVLAKRIINAMNIVYEIIDRTILILGFAVVVTGGVTYAGIARGPAVFSALAHFVKGGIFFWYGLLTLGRWMGCFADFGWAWNVKPSRAEVGKWRARIPSGEFTESFVIFLYGASNVFLEHLAAWQDVWSAQDLEHVSIAVMFFGGGLCGMLVESQWVRGLLNTSVADLPEKPNPSAEELSLRQQPKVYRTPMNPLPGLIIFLLGLMMSSHHQDSMVSTMVHTQWGMLLVGFSLARAVTYILLYLAPPTSVFPSRPPSELIAAFCLISGGLIFMASNKDVVAGMEFYDLNAMFIFTVCMGLTASLMAWEVVVLAIKGWEVQRTMPKSNTVN